jgi:hypothetical protein
MTQTQHFSFFLMPEFTHIAFSCALEPLRIANLVSGKPLYRWTFCRGRPDRHLFQRLGDADRRRDGAGPQDRPAVPDLGDGRAGPHHAQAACLAAPRTRGGHALGRHLLRRLCAGEGGVLDNMETALHWAWHDLFTEEFPEVRLVRNVFVAREKIITASGGTAAADLMLHLIGRATWRGSGDRSGRPDGLQCRARGHRGAARVAAIAPRHAQPAPDAGHRDHGRDDRVPDLAQPDRRATGHFDPAAGTAVRAVPEFHAQALLHGNAAATGRRTCWCRPISRSPRSRWPAAFSRPRISRGSTGRSSAPRRCSSAPRSSEGGPVGWRLDERASRA